MKRWGALDSRVELGSGEEEAFLMSWLRTPRGILKRFICENNLIRILQTGLLLHLLDGMRSDLSVLAGISKVEVRNTLQPGHWCPGCVFSDFVGF